MKTFLGRTTPAHNQPLTHFDENVLLRSLHIEIQCDNSVYIDLAKLRPENRLQDGDRNE